jgi:hypothetical protein
VALWPPAGGPTRTTAGRAGLLVSIPDGARHNTLVSLAGALRRRGLSAGAIAAALLTTNTERCSPPLPEAEVQQIAASVGRYAPGQLSQVSRSRDRRRHLHLPPVEIQL